MFSLFWKPNIWKQDTGRVALLSSETCRKLPCPFLDSGDSLAIFSGPRLVDASLQLPKIAWYSCCVSVSTQLSSYKQKINWFRNPHYSSMTSSYLIVSAIILLPYKDTFWGTRDEDFNTNKGKGLDKPIKHSSTGSASIYIAISISHHFPHHLSGPKKLLFPNEIHCLLSCLTTFHSLCTLEGTVPNTLLTCFLANIYLLLKSQFSHHLW